MTREKSENVDNKNAENCGSENDNDVNGRPPGPPPPQAVFKRGPLEKQARSDGKVPGSNKTQNVELISFLRLEAAQKRT